MVKKGEAEIISDVIGCPFIVDKMETTPLESLIVGKPVKNIEGHYIDIDNSKIQCKALMIGNETVNVTCEKPSKNKKIEN